jgi:hypothetical protein
MPCGSRTDDTHCEHWWEEATMRKSDRAMRTAERIAEKTLLRLNPEGSLVRLISAALRAETRRCLRAIALDWETAADRIREGAK